ILHVTLIVAPFRLYPVAIIAFLCIPLLLARLLLWEIRRPAFWVFLGTPCLLLLSSLMFFVLLDVGSLGVWALSIVVTLALALYTENLFAFYHLPSTYQAYALEYLTLIMYVVSA